MAPRATTTPRTTRNSHGLRRTVEQPGGTPRQVLGKRPAEGTELELLAQNEGQSTSSVVERLIPSPPNDQPQMSAYARLKAKLFTMGGSVLNLLGKFNRTLSGYDYQAVDNRHIDATTNTVVAKRLKRQVCVPAGKNPEVDLKNDLPYFVWADDPTSYVGVSMIESIYHDIIRQMPILEEKRVRCGVSEDVIREELESHEDLDLSIVVHKYMCAKVRTVTTQDSATDLVDAFTEATEQYYNSLRGLVHFFRAVYHLPTFSLIRQKYPVPPTRLDLPAEFHLGNYFFRSDARQGAELLIWFLETDPTFQTNMPLREAVSKIIMDVNAIHKQELPPSFVVHPGKEDHPFMPGTFPISIYDEISSESFVIDPVYALKHPSFKAPTPANKAKVPRIVRQPKGILKKQPKEWPQDPVSPRYVSTPDKKRRLGFMDPTAIYRSPDGIPGNVFSAGDALTPNFFQTHSPTSVDQKVFTHHNPHTLLPASDLNVHTARIDEPALEDPFIDNKTGERIEPFELHKNPRSENRAEDAEFDQPAGDVMSDEPVEMTELTENVSDEPFQTTSGDFYYPKVPIVVAVQKTAPGEQLATAGDRKKTLDLFFDNDDDIAIPTYTINSTTPPTSLPTIPPTSLPTISPTSLSTTTPIAAIISTPPGTPTGTRIATPTATPIQPLSDGLEISAIKLEQFEVNRQIRGEFVESLERQVREAEQRRKEEEEQRRLEAERQRQEEERRKEEEERQRREEEERQRREAEERQRQEDEQRRQAAEDERRRAAEARRLKEAAQYAMLTGLRAPNHRIVTPMTGEWNEKVMRASQADPSVDLTTTPDGNPLRRPDFKDRLLPATAWLNDNIIIGSILYIAQYINDAAGVNGKQNPKCSALTSFFWPRLQQHGLNSCSRMMRIAGIRAENFLEIDNILIPICEDSHWTLGVVCPSRRTVSHLDSMKAGASNPAIAERLLAWVEATLGNKFVRRDWQKITYQTPRQTNGWDCGVFTITNAICLALGIDPKESYSERELSLQRKRLAAMLLNGGFKGDFSLDGL